MIDAPTPGTCDVLGYLWADAARLLDEKGIAYTLEIVGEGPDSAPLRVIRQTCNADGGTLVTAAHECWQPANKVRG